MTINYASLLPKGYIDDPERGPVYAAAPDKLDDLTQIHGIGEVLEAQLNLNGVYRLEQIAAWNQTNIDAFSNMMPCFQDRIERNYWILQAQRIIERRQSAKPAAAIIAATGFPAGLIQTVLMMAIALLVGLLFVQWLDGGTPKTYAGNLKARTFHVVTAKPGTISSVLIQEGEQVLEGQEIATLHDSALDESRRLQTALVASLKQTVEAAEAKVELDLKWRVHELDREIVEHRQAIVAANEAPEGGSELPPPVLETSFPTKTASLSSPKKRSSLPLFFPGRRTSSDSSTPVMRATQSLELPTQGNQQPAADPFSADFEGLRTVVDPPTLQQISHNQIKTVAMSSTERIKLSEDRIRELTSLKGSLRSHIEQASGLETSRAALRTAMEELESLNDTDHEVVLTTAGFGVCSKVLCQPGDRVDSGQAVLELIDSRNQHVSAIVPSRHVDSFTPGMKVSLYFPGKQHRRGRINSLPVRTTELGESGETMLEIRIEPMGGLWPVVPIGSQVHVAID